MNDVNIENIELEIDAGNYEKALQKIEQLNPQQKFDGLVLKSIIYHDKFMVREEEENTSNLLELADNNDNTQIIRANLAKLDYFVTCGSFQDVPIHRKKIAQHYSQLRDVNDEERDLLKAHIDTVEGKLAYYSSAGKEGKNKLSTAIKTWEKYNKKGHLARSLHIYSRFHKGYEAIQITKKCQEIWRDLGNELREGAVSCILGHHYQSVGDFNNAIVENLHALKLAEKTKNEWGEMAAIDCLANIDIMQGKYKEAIKKLHRSNQIIRNFDIPRANIALKTNLGSAYFRSGEYVQAIKVLSDTLPTLDESEYHPNFKLEPLLYLLRSEIAIGNLEKAQLHSHLIHEISKNYPNKINNSYALVADGLVSKAHPRLAKKMGAQGIFEKIDYEDTEIPWFIRITALKNLCELLILEIELNDDPDLLIEVEILLIKILAISKDQHLFSNRIDVQILLSKLMLIKGNVKGAQNQLKEALNVAESNDLYHLLTLIQEEENKLLTNIEKWINLSNQNVPIAEKFKQAELEDYIIQALGYIESQKSVN